MKTHLLLFIFLAALFPLSVSAQDNMEDVIYLKNGTVYRDTMLDQQFGVSYKIQIQGGSVIVVAAADIVKITKERRASSIADSLHDQTSYPQGVDMGVYQKRGHDYSPIDLSRPAGKEGTGGFFEAQFSLQYAGLGIRAVGGYKFNQFAMLGAGIGVGGTYGGANTHGMSGDPSPYGGQYYPMFIYFGGDILKKEITPFYFLEAGYAMAANIAKFYDESDNPDNYLVNTTKGGPMGDVGIGVRIYTPPTRKRSQGLVLTFAADLNIQYARTDLSWQAGWENFSPLPPDIYAHTTMLMPGIKMGLGFIKQ